METPKVEPYGLLLVGSFSWFLGHIHKQPCRESQVYVMCIQDVETLAIFCGRDWQIGKYTINSKEDRYVKPSKAIQTNFVFVSFSAGNKTSMPMAIMRYKCGECTYPSVHLDHWLLLRFLIPSLIKTIPYSTIHYIFFLWQYGGFLKWWYPTTMVFLLKMIKYGGVLGYHHLRKHPYICMRTRNVAQQQLTTLGLDFLVAALDVVLNCSWRVASWFNGCFLVPFVGGR